MPSINLDQVRIAYDDAGPGPRTLLLVHGHPFDRTMWRPQVEHLRNSGWRVIAPDLRGYGASDVVPPITTLAMMRAAAPEGAAAALRGRAETCAAFLSAGSPD